MIHVERINKFRPARYWDKLLGLEWCHWVSTSLNQRPDSVTEDLNQAKCMVRLLKGCKLSENHISCLVSAYKTLKPLGLTQVQAKCFFCNSVAAITPMSCLWECHIILALLHKPQHILDWSITASYEVKRMIRGLGDETFLTYSQTLNM